MVVKRGPSEMRKRHVKALEKRLRYIDQQLAAGRYSERKRQYLAAELAALRFALKAIDSQTEALHENFQN